jgi:hypothetical protein
MGTTTGSGVNDVTTDRKHPGVWLYVVGLAIAGGLVFRATQLQPMIRACGDTPRDGGLVCTYESVTGPRVAMIALGIGIGAAIWSLTYLFRRQSSQDVGDAG